jgi:hypothetical protein
MRKQPDINDSMRTILVDWLVEVSEEYRLNTETLYLAVNYIDRFLSFMSVVRAKLQVRKKSKSSFSLDSNIKFYSFSWLEQLLSS